MSYMTLPRNRYISVMKRIRALIRGGLELKAMDDTSLGSKSTTCTWGLCTDSKDAWPDAKDHIWPDQFEKHGRVAPKHLDRRNRCPIDSRSERKYDPNSVADMQGCFYTCRVFKANRGELPSKEQVIQWYTNQIDLMNKKVKPSHGKENG